MFTFGKRMGCARRVANLEALRANVMIADAELNITYMNPALIALMREAEQT
jgi:methyl-accepting chemotaxis protein